MRPTEFESRHPTLLHLFIVGAAFATYAVDPDDVVWRYIRQYPSRRAFEHAAFFMATLLIGTGAVLCTWARAFAPHGGEHNRRFRRAQRFGGLLYAIGLASLAPLWGFVLLVAGESVRILRLGLREDAFGPESGARQHQAKLPDTVPDKPVPHWGRAFRRQSVQWGVFLTMIVFTITLVDRVADDGIVASVLAWMLLNLPTRRSQSASNRTVSGT